MRPGLACGLGKEQRAAETLGTIALGVLKLVGGVHTQTGRFDEGGAVGLHLVGTLFDAASGNQGRQQGCG